MTTYELPPEPPVGTQIVDNRGISWKRARGAAYGWDSLHMGGQCWIALLRDGPLTLIEPDPWPTAPLIVADMEGKRELFSRNDIGCYGSRTYYVASDTDVPLTNVVPVTVVPTAEWEAMATTVRSLTAPGTKGSLLNQAQALVKAADALGLD